MTKQQQRLNLSSEGANAQRILVRAPNWIGDHVMALPFYRGMKAAYPQAELSLIGPEAVVEIPVKEVFSQVIAMKPEERAFPKGIWALGQKLRLEKFTLGITLPASWSASFLLWASGIPERVGFRTDASDLFLTDAILWPGRSARVHKSEVYLNLLSWFSAKQGADLSFVPTDFPSSTPSRESVKVEKKIVICPGASISLREWPYFSDLLLTLRKNYSQYRLIVVGSHRESKWNSQLARWGEGIENWIGKTSLESLCEMMKDAALVIANDSGLAHVSASIAGAPTLVLMGPGDPRYILPQGTRVEGVRSGIACSPCESAVCAAPYGYQKCLRDLDVEKVMQAVQRILALDRRKAV